MSIGYILAFYILFALLCLESFLILHKKKAFESPVAKASFGGIVFIMLIVSIFISYNAYTRQNTPVTKIADESALPPTPVPSLIQEIEPTNTPTIMITPLAKSEAIDEPSPTIVESASPTPEKTARIGGETDTPSPTMSPSVTPSLTPTRTPTRTPSPTTSVELPKTGGGIEPTGSFGQIVEPKLPRAGFFQPVAYLIFAGIGILSVGFLL